FTSDVLPLFVAEMDYAIAEPIAEAIIARVRASDIGYLDGPGELAPAFQRFAHDRWDWSVPAERIHIATDVSVGIVESFRLAFGSGGRVLIAPPVYPAFFELIEEVAAERVEVPLLAIKTGWTLDLDGIEAAFRSGIDAFLLCNPHNPIGIVFDAGTLATVARLAARYDVLVISDEVHAPLTFAGEVFTPFATVAEPVGARSIIVTSASKGWNLAGVKCALVIAGDDRSASLLDRLPDEVACRTSILGLHANIAALSCTDWLDEAVTAIEANDLLLAQLLGEHLPDVIYHRPRASYLAWLDLRPLGLGDDPTAVLIAEARVALNEGAAFGAAGRGFARLNLACDPDTLREAIARIASAIRARGTALSD
ncbi:MAG TPA: aminotransferase class I/II-fold pyridoxal phosphate-dependent enzyme, partial [Kofleriaceae bacterium]